MIGLMKCELDKKVKTKSVGLEPNIFNYFKDNGHYIKKAKITNKCGIKQKIKFKNHKNFLEANWLEKEIKYLENIMLMLRKNCDVQ